MFKLRSEKIKKILTHIAIWFIPSSTPIYIILHEYLGYEMFFSYFISSAIPCAVAYPIEKWVMKK